MPFHLSPELLAIIISFLPKSCLPLLSTVSQTWQFAIERLTMSAIHLRSTDLAVFATVFAKGHRRLALAQLHYDAILPSYSDRRCVRYERGRDKALNNEALTVAIHDLFSLLHSWEHQAAVVGNQNPDGVGAATITTRRERGTTARPISLTMNAYSLSDAPYRDGKAVELQRVNEIMTDFFELRYEHSFLKLLRADELPSILSISTFITTETLCIRRRIEGASLVRMGAKMPNLEKVEWWVHDDEKRYPEVRRIHRFEFARSLFEIPLHSLRSLTLHLFNDWPKNHYFPLQNALLPSSPRTDHLSLALRHLSQSPNLTNLILIGDIVLSPSIFWPSSEQEDEEWVGMNKKDNNGSNIFNHPASSLNTSSPTTPSTPPLWPHLQKMRITLSITTPTGEWLYIPDPLSAPPPPSYPHPIPSPSSTHSSDSDNSLISDEYDYLLETRLNGSDPCAEFRKFPDNEKIDEWLLAMGKAVGHMPAIEDFQWEVNNQSSDGIEVNFLAGEKKWLIVVGREARLEVSPKIKQVLEDVGVGVRLEIEEF